MADLLTTVILKRHWEEMIFQNICSHNNLIFKYLWFLLVAKIRVLLIIPGLWPTFIIAKLVFSKNKDNFSPSRFIDYPPHLSWILFIIQELLLYSLFLALDGENHSFYSVIIYFINISLLSFIIFAYANLYLIYL